LTEEEAALAAGARPEHLGELRLARAAARGEAAAVREIDRLLEPEAAAAARRFERSPAFADEVAQGLRIRLLVASGDRTARIAGYGGRGPLRAWIGVAALRIALNLRRAQGAGVGARASDASLLAELASAEPDPELRQLKTLYRAELRDALEAALRGLPERQRAILRLCYVDGLRLAQLARLYGVHESTASRWLGRAAEEVAADTRRRLVARLSLSPASVDSVARMVLSGLDLSIARILGPAAPPPPPWPARSSARSRARSAPVDFRARPAAARVDRAGGPMYRSVSLPLILISLLATGAGCLAGEPSTDPPGVVEQAVSSGGAAAGGLVLEVERDHLVGDVYHHSVLLRVGAGPNALLRLHRVVRERAPWLPRATAGGIMLLHGDFATFATNFAPALGEPASDAPGLAVYLAQRGLDVWGLDRRWTQAPAEEADVSDFAEMGLAQEVDDIGRGLAFARAARLLTGSGAGRLALLGFSRGGQLAYAYTAAEATRPAALRHVKGLVPLDVYAVIAPEDEALRLYACEGRDIERELLADGVIDSENSFIIGLGVGALTAPDAESPFFPGMTNRSAILRTVAQTYLFFAPTPLYHLNAGVIEEGGAVALRETSEERVAAWFAGGAPHQSMREAAESDALWCNEAPLPVEMPLDRIRVPLFYLGAAGGFGDHGLYSTTLVGSSDVQSLVVRRFGPEGEAEDFGHADLLFGDDAEALAWQPLAAWLLAH
jgi:RNA polymerase sigma-70 factor